MKLSKNARPVARSGRPVIAKRSFLINPYGLTFDEITASSLVKIGLDGRKVEPSPHEVNPAGFTIHSAIHAAREDAICVMHLHTHDGVAVSAQRDGVLPISQQSMVVLSSLAYHDYEGIALVDDEKPRLVRDLADRDYLMLRNHGLLTVGDSVATAFLNMYMFQSVCAIQLRAQSGGGELRRVPEHVLAGGGAQWGGPAARRRHRVAGAPAQARPPRPFVAGLTRAARGQEAAVAPLRHPASASRALA